MVAKILVADDEPIIVDVLTRFLTREGYSVVTASSAVEALEKARNEQPDLILLDVTMPQMDGFEVCQYLKGDESTALIPVTLLTGLDDREHRTRGIESGADDFLTKPFEQSILRARIRSKKDMCEPCMRYRTIWNTSAETWRKPAGFIVVCDHMHPNEVQARDQNDALMTVDLGDCRTTS